MKEEALLRRRFTFCPPASPPQKAGAQKLSRSLPLSAELCLLGPGGCGLNVTLGWVWPGSA